MNRSLSMENFWGAAIAFRNADYVWAIWRLGQAWAYATTDYSNGSTEMLNHILNCREIIFKTIPVPPPYDAKDGYGTYHGAVQ